MRRFVLASFVAISIALATTPAPVAADNQPVPCGMLVPGVGKLTRPFYHDDQYDSDAIFHPDDGGPVGGPPGVIVNPVDLVWWASDSATSWWYGLLELIGTCGFVESVVFCVEMALAQNPPAALDCIFSEAMHVEEFQIYGARDQAVRMDYPPQPFPYRLTTYSFVP